MGTLVQTPRALAGRTTLRIALNHSEEPTSGPTASRRGHLCRFGFRGRNPSERSHRSTRNYHVETESTPIILWMSRGKYYILYFTPIPANRKSNPAMHLLGL